MNLTRKDNEDYTAFASVVNKHCNDFKLKIRRRFLNKLENEPNLTHQQTEEDCQRFVSVRQDSENIEEYGIAIFTNPSARAGYDTRSIFKRSLTGLNSEFSCS